MQQDQQIPLTDKRAQVVIIGLGPHAVSDHMARLIVELEYQGFMAIIDKGQCFAPDEPLNFGTVAPIAIVERLRLREISLGTNDPQYKRVPIWTPKSYREGFRTMPGSRQDRYSRPQGTKLFGKKPRKRP